MIAYPAVGRSSCISGVVDVVSCYKENETLTFKDSDEVVNAPSRIYMREALKWSKLLQADPGREFMDS